MGKRDKKRVDGAGFGGSFGDLLRAQGLAPAASAEPPEPAESDTAEPPADADLTTLSKIVLRRTRKGRGGRTATLIEGIDALSPAARDQLARDIRKALGTGATLDGDVIVVQGDIRDRLADWLEGQGARRIVKS